MREIVCFWQHLYDAAANLLTRPHTEAPHNQVQGSDKYDYRYDGFGRMVSRYEKGSSSGQRYHYDSDHRIIAVDIDQKLMIFFPLHAETQVGIQYYDQ